VLTARDVNIFKLLGGFNDDWDCCYGLLVYLLNLPVKGRTVMHLKEQMNLRKFADRVKERPLRVTGIVRMLGRPSFVTIEKISRIFQEIYLGRDLFRQRERQEPVYWHKRGLIRKERLIFKKAGLVRLRQMGVQLGIATGRSHIEAGYSLRHFGVADLFDAATTMDDVKRAEREQKQSLRKPNPYSLIETARKLGPHKRFLYVGDLPDDVLAVQAARPNLAIDSACYARMAADHKMTMKEVLKAGPDHILYKPSDLTALVMGRKIPGTLRKP
jgi:phosphoglycolate phosphatase-like HAD superfamily hydrolase